MTKAIKVEPSSIQNKMRRQRVLEKVREEKQKEHKITKKKKKSGEIEKKLPDTQETLRELQDDLIMENNEYLNAEENVDEFSEFISGEKTPKILLTTNLRPSRLSFQFLTELKNLIPNSFYYSRKKMTLMDIAKECPEREFTHILTVNERKKKPWSLSFSVLPQGPSFLFRVRKYIPTYEIFNKGNPSGYDPELILRNFNTALGRRAARGLASLFKANPEFKGRTVVTFHNQRDFIFFRHHRYIYKKKELDEEESKKAKTLKERVDANIQEIGPRFVL